MTMPKTMPVQNLLRYISFQSIRNHEKKNNAWNIRRMVNETIVPATQHIILKIVGFQEISSQYGFLSKVLALSHFQILTKAQFFTSFKVSYKVFHFFFALEQRVIKTDLIILFQKTFFPNVKGFISHESSSFENKWLRYPKIATNSKKKEMERLELLP